MSHIINETVHPANQSLARAAANGADNPRDNPGEVVETETQGFIPDNATFEIIQDLEERSISIVASWGSKNRGIKRRIFKMSEHIYHRVADDLMSMLAANPDLLQAPTKTPGKPAMAAAAV